MKRLIFILLICIPSLIHAQSDITTYNFIVDTSLGFKTPTNKVNNQSLAATMKYLGPIIVGRTDTTNYLVTLSRLANTTIPIIDTLTTKVKYRDTLSGPIATYTWVQSQISSAVTGNVQIRCGTSSTISAGGASLTSTLFANPIKEVDADRTTYQIIVDFVQNLGTSTITWINGATFINNQYILVKR